jgi:hypothetical protein
MIAPEKPMDFSDDAVFSVCGKVVVRRIGSDTLLVPVSGPSAGGRVFPVNDSACIVWCCLAAGGSVRSAADTLVQEYGIDRDEALADSRECIRTFLNEELVEKS